MQATKLKPWETTRIAIPVMVLMILLAFFGMGRMKIAGLRSDAVKAYTVTDDHGNSMAADFSARVNAAANLVSMGKNALGADNALVQAASNAVESAGKAQEDITAVCAVNASLTASVDALYKELQAQDVLGDEKFSSAQTQWSEFNSRNDLLYNGDYSAKAQKYNVARSGFPASLITALLGPGELPALS